MTNDIDDRLSRRFESGDEDSEQTSQSEETDMSSSNSQLDKKEQTSQKAQNAKNIKKEWNVRSFYLSDELDSELSTAYKRLDLNLSEADTEIDLKKTRHFYPLIVSLGLERLEAMETTEVTEELEGPDF